MKKIMKIGGGLLLGLALGAGAVGISLLPPRITAARPRSQPVFDSGAWVVSWDFPEGNREARMIQSQLNSVSYFGGVLDGQGKILVTGPWRTFRGEQFTRFRAPVRKYLTVTNDVYPYGVKVKEKKPKDTELLDGLLATPESRKAHGEALLQALKGTGCSGLEIDYEQVWKNPFTAYRYVKFLQELNLQAEEKKVPLRVILEPDVPANSLIFPEGPEYVIMAYNLYGTHSSTPGPKAGLAFVDRMLDKVARMPRPHSIAFATGGCVWEQGQPPRFVTEKEARALAAKTGKKPERDEKSQALHFAAKNGKGSLECWYADGETLKTWKHRALEKGVDGISVWRLGGNEKIRSYYPGLEE